MKKRPKLTLKNKKISRENKYKNINNLIKLNLNGEFM